jgi:hypothetical protein
MIIAMMLQLALSAPSEPGGREQSVLTAATAERAIAAAVHAFPELKREEKPVVRPDRFEHIGEPRGTK